MSTIVSAPTHRPATGYPPARGKAAGVFLRRWAQERYGDEGVARELADNLGVPEYRPAFDPDMYYGEVMTRFVEHVVERAANAAACIPLGAQRRPVIVALQEATSGKGTR